MLIARNSENKIVHYFFLFGGGGYSHYMLILRIFHYYSALVFEDTALFLFLSFFLKSGSCFLEMMMTIHC